MRRGTVPFVVDLANLPAAGRVGRPRRDRRPGSTEPRQEILAAAGTLFASQGVAGTSMAQIASAAGLQPSSVYYYFGSKSEILHELVTDANRVPLDAVRQVNAAGGSPAVRLWRLVRLDVIALCRFPYDINEIHRLSAQDPEAMVQYWDDREQLVAAVEAIVRAGVADGELRPVPPRLTALTLLGNDEGAQNWFRPLEGSGGVDSGRHEPEEIGEFLADLALRGLLARPSRLAAVRRAALQT
jgi:AcrR family transcriptional regulator